MATAPKIELSQSAPVLALSPHDVLIGERLGAFWPDKAAAIGTLMRTDGQDEPIKVRKSGTRAAKPWTLVAGLHRLEGALGEGLAIIEAIEVSGDDVELRRIEASENVARGKRSPLERANFIRAIADAAEARMQGQHEGLTQEQIAVRARWATMKAKAPGVERDDTLAEAEAEHTSANLALVYGWAEETADGLGMSRRGLFRDLALHRALIAPLPDLWRGLATHRTVGENASALREIAAVAMPARRDLVEALVAAPDMTVAQAKEGLGLSCAAPPAATGATKYMNNAAANIARLSPSQQRDFVPVLLKALKPSVLDLIVAEIASIKAGEA